MTITDTAQRFTALPDDDRLAATIVALEEHGFSVEIVDDLDAARRATLNRIPAGSTVMTNTSVTLDETGVADAINGDGVYDSARNRMFALDFQTQVQDMKAIAGQPDYALGERPRRHPRRDPRHRVSLGQPTRLLRLGRGQRHPARRSTEARPHPRRSPRAGLPAQP